MMISADYIQGISISVCEMVKNIYENRLFEHFSKIIEDEHEVYERVQGKLKAFYDKVPEFEDIFQDILTNELLDDGVVSFDSRRELENIELDHFAFDIRKCFVLSFGHDLEKYIGLENYISFYGDLKQFKIQAKTFLKDHYEVVDSDVIENVYDNEQSL